MKQENASNSQKVRIVFRDFLYFVLPCRHGRIFPQWLATIMFEHTLEFTPSARDLIIYKAWQPGKKVNTGHACVGHAHVASRFEDEKMITFTLNGTTQIHQLETSEKAYLDLSGRIGRDKNSTIREAVKKAFEKRIGDFKPHLKEWRCEGSGLWLPKKEAIVSLPKKFTPKGWKPRNV